MSGLRVKVEYEIEVGDEKLIKSLYEAILPEVLGAGDKCSAELRELSGKLLLKLSCDSISDIRALNNSLLSILSMLAKAREVFSNGGEEGTA